jgi:hypothetical protein
MERKPLLSIFLWTARIYIDGFLQRIRNEFDGHTLEPALEQTTKLVGKAPKTAAVDRGYRGRQQIGETKILIPKPFNN